MLGRPRAPSPAACAPTGRCGGALSSQAAPGLRPTAGRARAGEVQGADGQAERGEGAWQLPYLADENADEDPEVKASAGDGVASQRLRKAFLAHGKQAGPAQGRCVLFPAVSDALLGGPGLPSCPAPAWQRCRRI